MTHGHLLKLSASAAVASLLLAFSVEAQNRLPAKAGDFALKVDVGVAFPLTRPQSELFDAGGSQTIKGLWTLTPYLDIGPSATFVGLPASASPHDPGTAWAFGGSARIKRPHHAPGMFAAISPWLDSAASAFQPLVPK